MARLRACECPPTVLVCLHTGGARAQGVRSGDPRGAPPAVLRGLPMLRAAFYGRCGFGPGVERRTPIPLTKEHTAAWSGKLEQHGIGEIGDPFAPAVLGLEGAGRLASDACLHSVLQTFGQGRSRLQSKTVDQGRLRMVGKI